MCGLPDYLWLFMVVDEPTSNSKVYLHLCVVDISIWIVCDGYCELCVMHVIFIWVGYVIRDPTIKTGNTWSLYRVLHSAKRPFAECQGKNTRQRGHVIKICTFWASHYRVSGIWHSARQPCLPSIQDLTLGKSAMFAECQYLDTRQTRAYLPSVRAWALGKHGCFAEC